MSEVVERLQNPGFALGGLRVDVLGYELESVGDQYDDNWLVARVNCSTSTAKIMFESAVLRTDDLGCFQAQLKELAAGSKLVARLSPIENAVIIICSRSGPLGKINVEVNLSPSVCQKHVFYFEVWLSDIDRLILSFEAILKQFPER